MQENKIMSFAKNLNSDSAFFLNCQAAISAQFKFECQRFRMITGRTELTTTELDSIAENAAKNYLKSLTINEFDVSFQTVKAA